ncbi:MAG: chromosomal replication initiator protein DnaA [Firmicutes bacterium]|uniref:Chromosomal replication initiator protein DnaA n=1 Tax=Candidatus Colimorpha enterica TaxID=3083063 RepID=R6U1E3_9BACT|nr:chromosomal replication initiator protein DnaA [Candidatus Colimorpha enterica]MCI5754663.1 chromosomal replication initiator protein DnaA [Candidatus Colimorpha enterica]MDD6322964.1 chromosomal replication initiator protein DnaA [Bacillota bacterium]MDY2906032.1 chromosomal replication initiator protein DnaA [Eubacteriales bacterium]CDC73936.1 chromosomal replication initiator protein DnaA [Candidatus Colimorpha enterica]
MDTHLDAEQFNEIWSFALKEIQRVCELPDTMMHLWFNDMKLTLVTEDSVVLTTETDFRRDVVTNRYTKQLTEVMSGILGYPVTVSVVSGQKERNLEKKMTEAARLESADVDPAKDFYVRVGEQRTQNKASVPSAFREYTFENFVIGSSNRFAHAAALAVADAPVNSYNPLFIYGPSGVGKTHLLYAITNRITKNYPDYRVIYVSGEEFTNQLIDAIHRNITPEFREKYRKADVLLIDDIHFIAGKDSTQEEFFHTFNELYKNNKQIILTSDRPPKDIKTLENRLRTRFDSGLTADIQLPDLELRAAIIKMKAEAVGVDIPDDVVNYIAENINDSVRNLEGAVNKIGALNKLSGQNISLDLAVRCISDKMVGSEPVNVTIDKILHTVSSHYNITVEDMKSRKRISSIASARHVAVYIIKKMTDRSLPAIGREFNRDHTTIINSIDTVEKRLASDPAFDAELKELMRAVKS